MNTLLVGIRASGKSTVGCELALRLGITFVDLDEIVLAAFDEPTVTDVWASLGEGAWREAEAVAIEETLRRQGQVVALGGGTPMVESAKRSIEAAQRAGTARVVYLRVDAAEAASRLQEEPGDRPRLTEAEPADEIVQVLNGREPTYLALADVTLDTTGRTPSEVVERLVDLLSGAGE